MNHGNSILRAAAALVAAAGLAACNGGHGGGSVPAPVAPQTFTLPFSLFTQEIFAAPASSVPAVVDGVNINFDVDNNPLAFVALLM